MVQFSERKKPFLKSNGFFTEMMFSMLNLEIRIYTFLNSVPSIIPSGARAQIYNLVACTAYSEWTMYAL